MTHRSHRRLSAFATPWVQASLRRRLSHTATALATGWMLAACGGGGADSHSAATAETAAVTPSASAPVTAASTPGVAQPTPPAVVWNTSDKTAYQLKSAADLGLYPEAMNAQGDVAGAVNTAQAQYAAIWHDGAVEQARLMYSAAEGVNYPGRGAGITHIDAQRNLYFASPYVTPGPQFLLRHGATATQTLTGCSSLYATTDAGQFLCHEWIGPGTDDFASALWNLSTLTKTVLTGDETAMNQAGAIAGVRHAAPSDGTANPPTRPFPFRLINGGFTFLDKPGITSAQVTAINAQDVVIGSWTLSEDDRAGSENAQQRRRPFMWKGTEAVVLPCPQVYGQALDINKDGTVVGVCYLSHADGSSAGSIAALWKDGLLVDLKSHLAGTSGWTLDRAEKINDLGWVIAEGQQGEASRNERVLLMPQP